MFTLGQAAKEVSVSKATLSRAVKSGRISAAKNDKGGFDIDPSELFRVFPRNPATVAVNSPMKQTATPRATDETPVLMERIEALRTEIAFLRENAVELKDQRDSWKSQAEQAQRLLAAPAVKSSDNETLNLFQQTVATIQATNEKMDVTLQALVQKIEEPSAKVQETFATIQAANEKMDVTLQALVQKVQEPAASPRRGWFSRWFGTQDATSKSA